MSAALPATLLDLRRAIAAGRISAEEALRMQAERLQRLAPALHCVAEILPLAHAPRTGLLAGIGLAHKDIFDRPHRAPGCGAAPEQAAAARSPEAAAPVLERLQRAGAADLAALTMAEYACGATGDHPRLAPPVNPCDPLAVVGGSSSGSAVAVAAELCYGSLGTDTAGSVRIPAATCGLIGLKPTCDLLPRAGVAPLAPSLDTVGILARSAADAALLLAVAEGRTAITAAACDDLESDLLAERTFRLNTALLTNDLAPDVGEVLAGFADTLTTRYGGRITRRDVPPPALRELTACAETILHAEAAQTHWARLRAGEPLAPSTRAVVLPGVALPALWYREALARRAGHVRQAAHAYFGEADILLVPALPRAVPDWAQVRPGAPAFDARELLALHRWMPFINYLGFPAIVFPVGADRRGRPVCVQAIARPYAEATLLSFACRIERELHGRNGVVRSPHLHGHSFIE